MFRTEHLRITEYLVQYSDDVYRYTHAHRSDLDSECILSGESSVRELLSVYDPGVTENLKGIAEKITSSCIFQKLIQMVTNNTAS